MIKINLEEIKLIVATIKELSETNEIVEADKLDLISFLKEKYKRLISTNELQYFKVVGNIPTTEELITWVDGGKQVTG